MDSEIELVKVINESCLILRSKNLFLANNYYMGNTFLTYKARTYYCMSYQEVGGYYYMRMVTDE